MTQYIPAFLKRLTLGLDADTRAIRRAYARELKLIDQEADLAGFQLLREMYENALAWAARQESLREEPAIELPSIAPVVAAPVPLPTVTDTARPPPVMDWPEPAPVIDKSAPPPFVERPPLPPVVERPPLPPIMERLAPPAAFDKLPPPPAYDKLAPPPSFDKLAPPPVFDKLAPPPAFDKLAPPPAFDKLPPPPAYDKLAPPPVFDKLAPPAAIDKLQAPPAIDKRVPPPAIDKLPPLVFEKQAPPPRHEAPRGAAPNALAHATAIAEAAFAKLLASVKALAERGSVHDAAPWEAELRKRLNDGELINITARNLFEARVAKLLFGNATPWRGAMFDAATAVFDWEHDRRRVRQFGHAGAFLDSAIEERTMYERQDAAELVPQRLVMLRLRNTQMPNQLQLRRDMVYVERMVACFPNFMSVMVSPQVLDSWRSMSQAFNSALPVASGPNFRPAAAHRPAASKPVGMPQPMFERPPSTPGGGFGKGWILALILGLVQLGRVLSNAQPPAPPQYETPAMDSSNGPIYAPGVVPGKRKGEPGYGGAPATIYTPPFPMPAGAAPTTQVSFPAVVAAIAKDIDYKIARGAPKPARSVIYVALSTSDGQIYGVNVVRRSGDLAFDEAVKAAILRAKPLPPALRENQTMEFSYAPAKLEISHTPAKQRWPKPPKL